MNRANAQAAHNLEAILNGINSNPAHGNTTYTETFDSGRQPVVSTVRALPASLQQLVLATLTATQLLSGEPHERAYKGLRSVEAWSCFYPPQLRAVCPRVEELIQFIDDCTYAIPGPERNRAVWMTWGAHHKILIRDFESASPISERWGRLHFMLNKRSKVWYDRFSPLTYQLVAERWRVWAEQTIREAHKRGLLIGDIALAETP